MNSQLSPFSQWALDDSRTPDERYLIYVVCESCHILDYQLHYQQRQQQGPMRMTDWRQWREYYLNPLLLPSFNERQTETAAAMAPWFKKFSLMMEYEKRRIGNAGEVFRFFPALEVIELGSTTLSDLSFVTALPNLRKLQILSPFLEDLEPLAHCPSLRELTLTFNAFALPTFEPPLCWVDARPLGKLPQLEVLNIAPNAAILQGLSFPALTSATMDTSLCLQRDCEHLPDMPSLRHLTLTGVQSLRGIQRFPELRDLLVSGPLRDFGGLPKLSHLICLQLDTQCGWPRDLTPLTLLPSLLWARFLGELPRNYWPLTQAPKLCTVSVDAPSVQLDVQAINAALRPWDEEFLLPELRPLAPLRFVAIEPGGDTSVLPPGSPEPGPDYLAHPRLFWLELAWMSQRARQIMQRIFPGQRTLDAGISFPSEYMWERIVCFSLQTLEALQRLPEILEALREAIAGSPHRWIVSITSYLRLTELELTEQQKKWLQQIEKPSHAQEDEEESQRWRLKQSHLIETEFRLRSNQEDGEEPDPADFVPPEEIRPRDYRPVSATPVEDQPEDQPDFTLKPFDEQEQNPPGKDNNDHADGGNTATAPPPEPPPDFLRDPYAHPLADSYRFWATLTIDTFYHHGHNLATVMQLMRREPDVFHPAPKQDGS